MTFAITTTAGESRFLTENADFRLAPNPTIRVFTTRAAALSAMINADACNPMLAGGRDAQVIPFTYN
jgi:hypothetical protein